MTENISKTYVKDRIAKEMYMYFRNKIPEDIQERINFYKKLDEEYANNSYPREEGEYYLFSLKKIKNKNWRGVFLKATGMDEFLYINYLMQGIMTSEDDIIKAFKESHPTEKYIPNSIADGARDAKKYKHNNH